MKFLIVAVFFILSIAASSAQYFGLNGYPNFGGFEQQSNGFYGLNALNGDYSPFGSAVQRDARQNRGPVTFPQSPSDAPVESSGVIVGASGFGFVPPQNKY